MANYLETGLNWLQVVAFPGLGGFIWHLYKTHDKQTVRFDQKVERLEKRQDECEQGHIESLKEHIATKEELASLKAEMKTMSTFDQIKHTIIEGVLDGMKAVTCPLKGGCDNGKDTN